MCKWREKIYLIWHQELNQRRPNSAFHALEREALRGEDAKDPFQGESAGCVGLYCCVRRLVERGRERGREGERERGREGERERERNTYAKNRVSNILYHSNSIQTDQLLSQFSHQYNVRL